LEDSPEVPNEGYRARARKGKVSATPPFTAVIFRAVGDARSLVRNIINVARLVMAYLRKSFLQHAPVILVAEANPWRASLTFRRWWPASRISFAKSGDAFITP
jgi:hypothetical protein